MPGEMRKIAAFLDIKIDEAKWPTIVEHCTFDYMKNNATSSVPLNGALWEGGAQTFIHKGTNGRWIDTLSQEDIARYEAKAKEELGEACAKWLATGDM
jgi:aryl sulfotransferase